MFYPLHNGSLNIGSLLAASPNLALALLVVGLFGVYAEFCGPGRIWAGTGGSALLILGCWGLSRHPLQGKGLLLLGLSVLTICLQCKPPLRIGWSFFSVVWMYNGLVMLMDSPGINRWLALAVASVVAPLSTFLLATAVRARRNKLNREPAAWTGEPDRLEEA